jgi:hypothetical protein
MQPIHLVAEPFRLAGSSAPLDGQLPPHLAAILQQAIARSEQAKSAPKSSEAWTRANFAIGGMIVGAAGGAMAGALFWSQPGPTQIVNQPGPVQVVERPVIVRSNCLFACGE